MVRYGIIGVGAMGREHAENLRYIEGASVTAISDPDEGSRNLAIKQLGHKSPSLLITRNFLHLVSSMLSSLRRPITCTSMYSKMH